MQMALFILACNNGSVAHPAFSVGQRSRDSSHPAQDAHILSERLGGAPAHPGVHCKEDALSP